jgi:hypothetical protein
MVLEYGNFKEKSLHGRFVDNSNILPLANKHKDVFSITELGVSVKGNKICSYEFGTGLNRVLVWSQMHGNESTTTKALFDFFNRLHFDDELVTLLMSKCTFCVIPILNPDGANTYTRLNANQVDLNRDAQNLSQPESVVLKNIYDKFKPDYCFNLHGQRTIFSSGYSANSSVLSFLSPSQNKERTITNTRKTAMSVIATINKDLKVDLPNEISRYNDGFNINCVGDAFQFLGTPTILFEAGHFPGDYDREKTRYFIYRSLIASFVHIANNGLIIDGFHEYFNLPENKKMFYDVIIRNVSFDGVKAIDLAIQYQEVLVDRNILFVPRVSKLGSLEEYFGHKDLDGGGNSILINNSLKSPKLLTIIDEISINGVDFAEKISV